MSDIEKLREEAEGLGITVSKAWSEATLRKRIAEKRAEGTSDDAEGESDGAEEDAAENASDAEGEAGETFGFDAADSSAQEEPEAAQASEVEQEPGHTIGANGATKEPSTETATATGLAPSPEEETVERPATTAQTQPVGAVGDPATDTTVNGTRAQTETGTSTGDDLDARERDIARRERELTNREAALQASLDDFGKVRTDYEAHRMEMAAASSSVEEGGGEIGGEGGGGGVEEGDSTIAAPKGMPDPERVENVPVQVVTESYIGDVLYPAGAVIKSYTGALGPNIMKGRMQSEGGTEYFIAGD